jgi:hypothetical protein
VVSFYGGAYGFPVGQVRGCEECNREAPKAWPIFTVNMHGVAVCAKCLTPMHLPRAANSHPGSDA